MIVYTFLLEKIIPLFVDISLFPEGEKIFFYFFVAVLTGCLVITFLYIPFKLIWNMLSRLTNNKKNTHFDLW
jgi:hypothetical protein